ncbi:MAG: hypothetical protein QXK12_08505 [Candidatus Nezhaarchaeales archaeon]
MKTVVTRIEDEDFVKLMKRCTEMECSVAEYLRILIKNELEVKEEKKEVKTPHRKEELL